MGYINFLNKRLLTEGGSYGRISFLYENRNLTLKKFKEYLYSFIDGTIIKKSDKPTEIKTDGQNMMMSYKDGDFIFARNKSHLIGFGEGSLTSIKEVEKHLKNIPYEVVQSFSDACSDMIDCLKEIDDVFLKQIFDEGGGWLSFEIINPETKNVFDYKHKALYLQSIMIVDEKGTSIEENKDYVKTLYEVIEENELEHQKSFVVKDMVGVVFNKNPQEDDDRKYIDEYFKQKILEPYNLKENHTIENYLHNWWVRYIKTKSPFGFNDDDIEELINRFIDNNNNINIRLIDFEKNYGEEVALWIKQVEKDNKKLIYASNEPIRFIYDEIGYRSINNLKTHLSSEPEETLKTFKEDLKEKIKEVKSMSVGDDRYDKFNEIFIKINKHRPIETLNIHDEGYTFFKGKRIYKVTGYFSHVNQLFGVGKY